MSSGKAFPEKDTEWDKLTTEEKLGKNVIYWMKSACEKQKEISRLRAALKYYASYLDGNNPEYTKSGWLKYPDPKIAKEALAGGKDGN